MSSQDDTGAVISGGVRTMSELAEDEQLTGNFDAKAWAHRFVVVRHNVLTGPEHVDIAEDEETMLGWFANAIMTGFDHGRKEAARDTAALDKVREAILQRDRPA